MQDFLGNKNIHYYKEQWKSNTIIWTPLSLIITNCWHFWCHEILAMPFCLAIIDTTSAISAELPCKAGSTTNSLAIDYLSLLRGFYSYVKDDLRAKIQNIWTASWTFRILCFWLWWLFHKSLFHYYEIKEKNRNIASQEEIIQKLTGSSRLYINKIKSNDDIF